MKKNITIRYWNFNIPDRNLHFVINKKHYKKYNLYWQYIFSSYNKSLKIKTNFVNYSNRYNFILQSVLNNGAFRSAVTFLKTQERILKMAILLPHPLQPTCVQRRRRFSLHRRWRFSPHRPRWGIYSPNRWRLPFLYTGVDELVALASGRLPSHDDKLPETMAAHKAQNDYFCNSPETFSRDENSKKERQYLVSKQRNMQFIHIGAIIFS